MGKGFNRFRSVLAQSIQTGYETAQPALKSVSTLAPLSKLRSVHTIGAVSGLVGDLNSWACNTIYTEFHHCIQVPSALCRFVDVMASSGSRSRFEAQTICSGTWSGHDLKFMYKEDVQINPDDAAAWKVAFKAVVRDNSTRLTELRRTSKDILFEISEWMPELMESPLGNEILADLKSVLTLTDHRAILLTGKPGVGKSVMAAYIASQIDPTFRILHIDLSITPPESGIHSLLDWLQPDVLVVDELDKVSPATAFLDGLKSRTRLVIYTANNGLDDTVLDGSVVRPGRIDQVYEINSLGIDRMVPSELKSLPTELVDEILSWPAAAINEVILRAGIHGDSQKLGLDEIRHRVHMKCRSPKSNVPKKESK